MTSKKVPNFFLLSVNNFDVWLNIQLTRNLERYLLSNLEPGLLRSRSMSDLALLWLDLDILSSEEALLDSGLLLFSVFSDFSLEDDFLLDELFAVSSGSA